MEIIAILRRVAAKLHLPRDNAPERSSVKNPNVHSETELARSKTGREAFSPVAPPPSPEPLKPLAERRLELHKAIQLVGNAPLSEEKVALAIKTFSSLLQDPVLATEARVWRAICIRISGEDAYLEFKNILESDPDNRLAFVNLIANCLTRYPTTDICDDQDRLSAFAHLQDYMNQNPHDIFAKFLNSFYQIETPRYNPKAALKEIENIYLISPDYSPAISTMAVLLSVSSLNESAKDYAQEAMTKDPHNFQAIGIARFLGFERGGSSRDRIEHAPGTSGNSGLKSILCAAYFTQDPLARDEIGAQSSNPDIQPI